MASLRGQTPSTQRIAPVPETPTLENPNARNFLAISALSANRSTESRTRVARYRFPSRTVKSPEKLALSRAAVIAKATIAFSKMRRVVLVIENVLSHSKAGQRFSMVWEKQTLHGEISKPERISHPVRHKVQQLFADGYS